MSDIKEVLNDTDLLTDQIFTTYKDAGGGNVIELGWDSSKKWPYMKAKKDIEINYTYDGIFCIAPYYIEKNLIGYIFPNNPSATYEGTQVVTFKLLAGDTYACVYDLILADQGKPGNLQQNNFYAGYSDFTAMNLEGTEGVKFDLRIQYNKGATGVGMLTYLSDFDYISVTS